MDPPTSPHFVPRSATLTLASLSGITPRRSLTGYDSIRFPFNLVFPTARDGREARFEQNGWTRSIFRSDGKIGGKEQLWSARLLLRIADGRRKSGWGKKSGNENVRRHGKRFGMVGVENRWFFEYNEIHRLVIKWWSAGVGALVVNEVWISFVPFCWCVCDSDCSRTDLARSIVAGCQNSCQMRDIQTYTGCSKRIFHLLILNTKACNSSNIFSKLTSVETEG